MLIPVHWLAQVTFFDVYAHILCSGRAENAVPQYFGRCQIDGMSSDVAWVLDEVSTSGDADPVWFLLLWELIDYQSPICDDSISRDFSYSFMGEYK